MNKKTNELEQLKNNINQNNMVFEGKKKQHSRLDIDAVRKAYKRYASLYDTWFGPVMQRGRKESIERLNCRSGEIILEVGVGTGLSLPLYPRDVQIIGIDISPEMLEQARARKENLGLDNVIELRVMNAECMDFPDNYFDKVAATYVASVVPHPERLVNELKRVCKPNGELFILNHFQSVNPALATVERLLTPLSRFLGFHPDLCLESFVKETSLEVIDITSTNLFGYWKLVRARNNKRFSEEIINQPLVKIAASQ
ncbi:phosphatidylethanolamine N-methyltransferase [Candidatus Nitrosoglobus terrae]|uniref:Phosphatidylethanolamine N-methyltransferase n=1 Tax=Candidatus Nitrosoglobus terrae TaxID=1630141 RepID=A0A1Q2SNP7_9GAMM|nr:methyltransferase domain-containing protein [Candidatus Nitrosoglobus terrae]BAW80768.1 phosphatidylethanolamine N-methyltransferase [Candidatus Nitrosoglobus terrae]